MNAAFEDPHSLSTPYVESTANHEWEVFDPDGALLRLPLRVNPSNQITAKQTPCRYSELPQFVRTVQKHPYVGNI